MGSSYLRKLGFVVVLGAATLMIPDRGAAAVDSLQYCEEICGEDSGHCASYGWEIDFHEPWSNFYAACDEVAEDECDDYCNGWGGTMGWDCDDSSCEFQGGDFWVCDDVTVYCSCWNNNGPCMEPQ